MFIVLQGLSFMFPFHSEGFFFLFSLYYQKTFFVLCFWAEGLLEVRTNNKNKSESETRHDILITIFQTVRVLTKTRLLMIIILNTSLLNILEKMNIQHFS